MSYIVFLLRIQTNYNIVGIVDETMLPKRLPAAHTLKKNFASNNYSGITPECLDWSVSSAS